MHSLVLDRAYSSQRSSSEQIGIRFVSVLLISLVLISAKSPDALLNPQFWAEDGSVFYAQQFGRTWPLLFVPYAGYLHFIPRMIAWLASGVEPARVPVVYNLSAIVIQGLCIAYAATRMSFWFGAVIAILAFFLTPTAGDIFATITNIQWVAQFALMFGLLRSALNRSYRIGDGVAAALILVASLTGPFSVIAALSIVLLWSAGLAARRVHLRRFAGSVSQIVSDIEPTRLAALFLGATAQLVTMATHPVRTPTPVWMGKELEVFDLAHNMFFKIVVGSYSNGQLIIDFVYFIIFISMMAIAIKQIRATTLLTVFLLIIGAAQPLLAYLKQHEGGVLSPLSHYFYFLAVISFCGVAKMAMSAPTKYRWGLISSATACLALFFFIRPQYLIRAPFLDLHWSVYAAEISAGEHNVVVPLNPFFRAVINQ
jgi:hypothetical protein